MKTCKFCGKELTDEMNLCPFCMKKQDEEQPKASKKIDLKIVIIVLLSLLIIVGVVIGCVLILSGDEVVNTNSTSVVYKNSDESEDDIVVSNDGGNGITLDGSVISWGNMEIDNPNLNLTEDQIKVLKYFDTDYLRVYDYDNLQRYPTIYKNAQICFPAIIHKVLEYDDEKFKCLAYMDFEWNSGLVALKKEPIIIYGKQSGNARLIKGDCLYFYGRYIDSKSIEINGKTNIYPHVSVNYFSEYDDAHGCSTALFDIDYVSDVAKILLGENIKIKVPVAFEDYQPDEYHNYQYYWYLVTPENQSNANFKKFEFPALGGFFCDPDALENPLKNYYVSADFKHFIVTTFDKNSNLMYLDYYDREFNKIWGREFKDIDNVELDYTSDYIYLSANNDLYCISTKNGKDKMSPVMVGEKIKITVVKDGIIMVGTGNKDNIMKVDFDGDIVWKSSIDLDVNGCSKVQVVDENIVLAVDSDKYDNDGKWLSSIQKNVSVSSDNGKINAEFIDFSRKY